MPTRLEQLRMRMDDAGLTTLLVTGHEDILYLSGFSGSAGALLITADSHLLASDFRYQLQAEQEAPEWPFVLVEGPLFSMLRTLLAGFGAGRVGFDAHQLTVAQYELLGGAHASPYQLVPAPGLVDDLRLVKSSEELACIQAAARVTDGAYAHLLSLAKPGVTEQTLALEAEWYMRTHGAQSVAFDLIIAAGPNGALPHAQPGARALQPGDLVVVDMGARLQHYCSDMTRTFGVVEADATAQAIYRLCWQAQQAGLAAIHAGMTGGEADAVVRQVIIEGGYGPQFGHGTGHGVGLAVHEEPRLRPGIDAVLPAGAVVTVEPGIYLPNQNGVRIEDLVLLTDTGLEILSHAPNPPEIMFVG